LRVFVFGSQTRQSLGAFAGDPEGSMLPEKFGPWRLIWTVPRNAALPHGVARLPIERAIAATGFQLYRFKPGSEPA
jgi:hypothetical protein